MGAKRSVIIFLLSFFVFILIAPFNEILSKGNEANASEQKAQVLLVIRHGVSWDTDLVLKEEVGVMTSMLEEAGFKVIVASASGELIEGQTLKLKPDLKFADVKSNDYVGVIMPCLYKPSSGRASAEEISLVKQAVAQGKPIAAQRNAVIILAEAGVLVGKKCTFKKGLEEFRDSFAGAIYSGQGVIQDGNIITSSTCPSAASFNWGKDGTSELTKLFIVTIKD